jgi:hypothetical protein
MTDVRIVEVGPRRDRGCRLPSKGTWLRTGVDLGALLDVAVWIKTVLGALRDNNWSVMN